MLQTIEIEIDTNGQIHIVEPVARLPAGRGLLTLLQGTSAANKPVTHRQFDDLFGILTATHSVSLEDMECAISQQGQERLNDCN
jgi:hypothetical protein